MSDPRALLRQNSTALAVIEGDELGHANGREAAIEAIQDAEVQLERLVERGDVDSLHEIAVRAGAARMYEDRNGFIEMANRYARLKVLDETAIGAIDLTEHPILGSKRDQHPPLVVGETVVGAYNRDLWRVFAITHERGLLVSLLEEILSEPGGELTSNRLMREMRRRGTAWASPRVLRQRFDELAEAEGLTRKELSRRSGLDVGSVRRITNPNNAQAGDRVSWLRIKPIAEAMGLDPADASTVPPAPLSDVSNKSRRRRDREAREALKRQRQEKAIKQAVRKAGAATAEAWAMAERLQDVLAQAQRETTDNEARRALSLAGEHYRLMRDKIVLALGVTT